MKEPNKLLHILTTPFFPLCSYRPSPHKSPVHTNPCALAKLLHAHEGVLSDAVILWVKLTYVWAGFSKNQGLYHFSHAEEPQITCHAFNSKSYLPYVDTQWIHTKYTWNWDLFTYFFLNMKVLIFHFNNLQEVPREARYLLCFFIH